MTAIGRRLAIFGLALGVLGGCAVLQTPTAPSLFTLNPAKTFAAAPAKADWQLAVETPSSSGAYDSPRIMTIRDRTAVEPFANVSWTDRAPAMLGSLMVESFENSHAVMSVGRDSQSLRSDFLLTSELRDFQAEYDGAATGAPKQVRVRLVAKLVAMPRRTVEASETFEAVAPVTGNDVNAIVAAFDRATGEALGRLVPWTLATGNAMRGKGKE